MLLLGLLFGLLFVSQIEGAEYFIDNVYFDEVSDEYFDVAGTQASGVWLGDEDSGLAINLTITKQIPVEAVGRFQLYGKKRGDVKLSTEVFGGGAPWCELWNEPTIFNSLGTALGINESNCPPPIGYYQVTYWQPSIQDKKLMFQPGDHKVVYTLTLDQATLLSLVGYVELYLD